MKISITSTVVVIEGETANITATASGIHKMNFIYQWGRRGGNGLPNKALGINGTVLTIPNVTESDEGQYYCVVTNEWGRSTASDDVNLTISGT